MSGGTARTTDEIQKETAKAVSFLRLRGGAAPAASRFPPDGEAASGGHISFCEERNVEKKVA